MTFTNYQSLPFEGAIYMTSSKCLDQLISHIYDKEIVKLSDKNEFIHKKAPFKISIDYEKCTKTNGQKLTSLANIPSTEY
jgi:hypothetical protein